VLRTPVRASKANSVCERFGGTLRRECLDFLIPFNAAIAIRFLNRGCSTSITADRTWVSDPQYRRRYDRCLRVRIAIRFHPASESVALGFSAGFTTSTGSRKKRHSGGSTYCGALQKNHRRSAGFAGGSLLIGGSRMRLYADLNRSCGCPIRRIQRCIMESWLAAILRLRRVR
jgi:hypothetical protein